MDHPEPPRTRRLLWIVAVVLLTPIAPLLAFGEGWARGLWDWGQAAAAPIPLAAAATGLLAADIFLPVPSAPLVVLLAARLGVVAATAVGVAGLTLGGLLGYGAARSGGRAVALRLASRAELERWEALFRTEGAWLVVVTRPLPIVAECVVLAAGLGRMPVGRFVGALTAGNLLVVAAYAWLGDLAARHELAFSAAAAVALASLIAIKLAPCRQRA